MAPKTVRIGALVDISQYDDGDFPEAADFDGQPVKIGASTAGDEAVRQDQLPTLGNIVSASANITDHAVVRGDGGSKGIQGSQVTIDDAGSMTLPAGQTVDGMDPSAHIADPSAHHIKYTDVEARAAINNIFGSDGKADADIDLDAQVLKQGGIQVVGAQQLAEADAAAVSAISLGAGADTVDRTTFNTDLSTLVTEINAVRTTLNNLLAKLRTHGLIDT